MVTAVYSSPGPRHKNEDSALGIGFNVQTSNDNGGQSLLEVATILIVLDGVSSAAYGYEGSHCGGALLAQNLIVDLCALATDSNGSWNPATLQAVCQQAVEAANAFLYQHAQGGLPSHVTTLVLLVHAGEHAVIVHLGDGTIYRFRDGRLTKLVREHTLLNERPDADPVSSQGVITRALGKSPIAEADYQVVSTSPGDLFVLASDGVSGVLEASVLASIIAREIGASPVQSTLDRCAQAIVSAALLAGTTDNASVALGWVAPPSSNVTKVYVTPPTLVLATGEVPTTNKRRKKT